MSIRVLLCPRDQQPVWGSLIKVKILALISKFWLKSQHSLNRWQRKRDSEDDGFYSELLKWQLKHLSRENVAPKNLHWRTSETWWRREVKPKQKKKAQRNQNVKTFCAGSKHPKSWSICRERRSSSSMERSQSFAVRQHTLTAMSIAVDDGTLSMSDWSERLCA